MSIEKEAITPFLGVERTSKTRRCVPFEHFP
jgi:hypothetical protein